MQSKTIINKGSHSTWSPNSLSLKGLVLITLLLAGFQMSLQAQVTQTQYTKPSWWFGVAAGANFNFYRGSTQQLNADLTVPTTFHKGFGTGLYVAPLLEFHRPDSRWGIMLQAGYDSRKGKFNTVISPCNCPADLSTKLSYITIEPSLRFAPFKSNFYLFGGPRFALNLDKSFTFTQGTNPNFPEQIASPSVQGDFSSVEQTIISMQIGAGYDMYLSKQDKHTQFVFSPFVSFQPYFGQSPRSVETWNITTVRVGAALKFGRGHKIISKGDSTPPVVTVPVIAKEEIAEPTVQFSVKSPQNIPVALRVKETFPIRNYVFFDLGSTVIPQRYILLNKDQVQAFKDQQESGLKTANPSSRSERQMIIYYNILNILGDRMQRSPSSTITLVGSSANGPEEGRAMAKSIQFYLVDVFGIEASRIKIEGRSKPKLPSLNTASKQDLTLLREGDNRVSIESNSPALLAEYNSGPNAPLTTDEINTAQVAPIESYVTLSVKGAKEAFTLWTAEVTDDKGAVQTFGPYTAEEMQIPGKDILGTRPEGDYKVKMIGITKNGNKVTQEANMHIVLWTPPRSEEGMRFSVIFEFNESKVSQAYQKYLANTVVPKIPAGASIVLQGYADVIGDEDYNKKLSVARANEVRNIMNKSLVKAGRSDVKFQISGYGEDPGLSQFNNKYPEERFYNRTVIIDLVPNK